MYVKLFSITHIKIINYYCIQLGVFLFNIETITLQREVLWEIFLCGLFMKIRSNKTDYEETKCSAKTNGGRQLAAFPDFAEHEVTEIE